LEHSLIDDFIEPAREREPLKPSKKGMEIPTNVGANFEDEPLKIPKMQVTYEVLEDYWNRSTLKQLERFTLHVYRLYPVMLDPKRKLAPGEDEDKDNPRKAIKWNSNDFAMEDGTRITLSKEFIFSKLGSGDYSFRLNDNHPKVRRTVMYATLHGLRDYANYMPNLNLKQVAWSDPYNKDYRKQLQLRGIAIPNEEQILAEENGDEMATKEALGVMADALKDMTGKVLQQQQEQPKTVVAPITNGSDAPNALFMETAMDIVREKNKQASPVEQLRGLADVVGAIIPKQDNSAITEMLKQASEDRRQAERLLSAERMDGKAREERLLLKLLEDREKPAPAVTQVTANPTSWVDEYKKMKEIFGDIDGGGGSARDENEVPWWNDLAKTFMQHALPSVVKAIEPWGRAYEMKIRSTLPPEAQAVQQAVQAQQQPTPEQLAHQRLVRALDQAAPIILSMLRKGESGANFADMVIDFSANGRADYLGLQAVGKDQLIQVMILHPEINALVASMPRQAVEDFVQEFLDHDKIREAEGDEEGEG